MNCLRHTSLAVLLLLYAPAGYAQIPGTSAGDARPNFTVQIWGNIAAAFSDRIETYLTLRHSLEEGLPPLMVTDDPADIGRAERTLARRIRIARASATQGDLFTPDVGADFRRVLLLEADSRTRAAIMDENPGTFSIQINGSYPKERSLSTVPANILAVLPRLADDIQYRFLGTHLVLHDTRANVVLDRLPCAIGCEE